VFDRPPDQLGFVVEDLEAGVAAARAFVGPGPWNGYAYTADRLSHRIYHGQPSDFETRSAVWRGGRVGIVQPVAGQSVYADALARGGRGLHHLGYFVADLAAERLRCARLGVVEVMSGGGHGLEGDGAFAFFVVPEIEPLLLELIEPPRRRRPPDFLIE
jgi:methylmalonyl-CoA/ethylmalonyl-CoA epimerase